MEEQINQEPVVKQKKTVSVLTFTVVVVLLFSTIAGLLWLFYTTNNKLLSELENVSESISIPTAKNQSEEPETKTPVATSEPSTALISSIVQSVCAADLSNCTDIKVVKTTSEYVEVSLNSTYQNTTDQLPVRSMLLKNAGSGVWKMVFTSNEAPICGTGTDSPDMVKYCRE